MKKNSTSQSAFFNLRVLLASVFCLAGVFVALLGFGMFSNASAQADATQAHTMILSADGLLAVGTPEKPKPAVT
jgi:hypothetical protein